MKKINLAISGCMGRMGQQLIRSSKKNKKFKLVTLTENRLVNKKFNGIKPELNSDKAFKKSDVIMIISLVKERLNLIPDIEKETVFFYKDPNYSLLNEKVSKNEDSLKVLNELGIDIAFKDSMTVDYEMGMNSINNSSLEIARQDHVEILKMMN